MQTTSSTTIDPRDIAATRRRLETLAWFLDSAVRVPGTSIRVGADAALNVVPGLGPLTAKVLAAYLIFEARRLGVPASTMLRMFGHLGVDFLIGIVPFVGWVADVFYRSNQRNMAILRDHLDGLHARNGAAMPMRPGEERGGPILDLVPAAGGAR
jgi:hypothetical protein